MNVQSITEDQRSRSGFSLNNTFNLFLFLTKPYCIPSEHLEYKVEYFFFEGVSRTFNSPFVVQKGKVGHVTL